MLDAFAVNWVSVVVFSFFVLFFAEYFRMFLIDVGILCMRTARFCFIFLDLFLLQFVDLLELSVASRFEYPAYEFV